MDAQKTGWIAYCTLVGWFIAFFAGDREGAKFHINQALVIWIAFAVCAIIPVIGWIAEIFVVVCFVMGLIAAIKGEENEVPLLGKIHIIK